MLVLLLVCLMKLVDISTLNRPRRNGGGSKENRAENGQKQFDENHQEQHQKHLSLTPQQYQQLKLYQLQRQKQFQLLQQQLLLKHKQQQQQQQQQQQLKQQTLKKCCGLNICEQGTKSLRGMTEHPSNDNKKSRLTQLNHNSSPQHQQHNQQQKQQQHQHQQQQHHIKRPLTSPNLSYKNYGFTNYNNQQQHHQQTTNHNYNDSTSFDNFGLDELTEENLKKNLEIVLNNLIRNNNALQNIKLNEKSNLNNCNNNNNINNNNNYNCNQQYHYNNLKNNMANILSSPESDFNSNPSHPFLGHLNCSIASSHDFTHDNSDYQWFLDYGYRDGVAHQSVLSSLSASYNGIGELSYYEDLAKNIDANLAEVDMDNFRAEDIHSLLTHIPSLCKEKRRQEQNDIMIMDNSICKSELLFSPVKECHISVDSLDLESYPDDGDIILTCKANKDNYTIAFEGSALYSDESFYGDIADHPHAKIKQNYINLHSNLDDIVKRKSLEVSMSRSDHAFTTWSKLKKSSTSQLQRYPSGNNNTSVNIISRHAPHCIVRKSCSLPNLRMKKENCRQLNVSQAISTSTVDSYKSRNLLPMCQMPISTSGSESPVHNSNIQSSESSSKQNQPAFNLVKLFIKQKSSSSDTCMDVSSGCWPSDASSSLEQRIRKKSMNDSGKGSALSRHEEEGDVGVDSSYQLDSLDICEQNNIKNKDGIVTTTPTNNTTPKKGRNDLYREVFDSPANRNHFKECNMNIRNQPLKNPQIYNLAIHNSNNNNNNNNNNSLERDSLSKDYTNKSLSDASRTSENLTQVFCNNNSHNNRMKIPVEMITRSMQTSMLLKDKFRLVPPSFLAQLNKLGVEKRAPVYVIYPSYALPDLGFVKNNLSDVILSPINYKEAIYRKKRPTSFTNSEEEALKNVDYKQVADWKSLVTLLPIEYRKRLKHIPEADVDLDPECSQRPLFCMTPPLRRHVKTNTCDCGSYFQACTSSSGSGSSQPPSSGYRGSSTLLTDSEFETVTAAGPNVLHSSPGGDPMKNMYVYQYENNRMELNEVTDRPPPSGRTPRGILRRNLRAARTKRNSMFEEENSNIKNLEKRRSLQEPYYMSEDYNIIEDYLAEIEENKSKQYYNDFHQTNLKFNKPDDNFMMELNAIDKQLRKEQDLDARARAENFLSSVPKSELKYYAEIANILESADNNPIHYDRAKLKNEVSRALSQKKVSFNQPNGNMNYLQSGHPQKFSTPPNSPNISMAALRVNNNNNNNMNINQRLGDGRKELTSAEKEKQDKISSNRFKRLQIQWELLSKDSSVLLKDLAREKETKSGGSTPTSSNGQRSRIPRPVSYPATKCTQEPTTKTLRSPSRIVPPKKYNVPPVPVAVATPPPVSTVTITTARPRTPSRLHNTPKKRVPSPRPTTRTR